MRKNNIMKKSTVTDINGTKVFIENGEVKTVLSEQIQQSGYMDIETAFQIIHEAVDKQYEICNRK